MSSKALRDAKEQKKDEFYTLYEDIEKEINEYYSFDENIFLGKVSLCPCDTEHSNFTKYFIDNFDKFGIKRLICTSYSGMQENMKVDLFSDKQEEQDTRGKIITYDGKELKKDFLAGNGDFRSEEVTSIRDGADMIITNPPFSLCKDFILWATQPGKQVAIIGNMNALTNKNIFKLIKENKLWAGSKFNGDRMRFIIPDDYHINGRESGTLEDGTKYAGVGGVCWVTNIPLARREKELELTKSYDSNRYKKYVNVDAINVDSIYDIPFDYSGNIGVPITFIGKHNPEQFDLVDCCEPALSLDDIRALGKEEYVSRQKEINGIKCQKLYHRVIIRKRGD